MPPTESSEPKIHSRLAAICLTQALIRYGENPLSGEFREVVTIKDDNECLARLLELAKKKRLDVDIIIRTKNGGC